MMQRARRLVLVFAALLFCGLLALGGRLSWIALATHETAALRMDRQSTRSELLEARRGSLFDRHGRTLACSVQTLRAEVLPRNVHRRADDDVERAELVNAVARFLSPYVAASVEHLVQRLSGERWTVLGEAIEDPRAVDLIESERRGLLYGVDLRTGWSRRYPWGRTAGNLIGYVNHELKGVAGLEQGLDAHLQGHDGARRQRVDHVGRIVVEGGHEELPPVDGLDVTLTIDARIQQIAEEEAMAALERHSAKRVTVVAMDPRSGDILAISSVPGLDLSDTSDRPRDGSTCAALQEIYPPGSTFKPLMMATAMQLGLAHPDEPPLDCRAFDGPRRIRDTHPKQEPLSLEEIIVHSSNIGMANLLTRIVPKDQARNTALMRPVYETLKALGLGEATDLPLPAEATGIVTPLERWDRTYTLASVAFGQELGVSAMQMAAAASTLCDGLYRRPRLVHGCAGAGGEQAILPREPARRVFRPDIVDEVRRYMARSVEEGSCEEVKLPGVAVAGKTGTAEAEIGGEAEVHSYSALVPAAAPFLSLVVVVRDPQDVRYASQTAGPAAGRILARVLPYLGQPIGE